MELFDGPTPDSSAGSSDPSSSPSPNSQTQAPTQPSLSDKAAVPKKIFFSYGHDANRELVDRFKGDLEKRGHTVWIDYKQIDTWSDWKGKITQGIHDSGMAIAFLSFHSTRKPGVCQNEIAMALHHFGIVYPILVEDKSQVTIPITISNLQWPDLSQWRQKKESNPEEYERFYEQKLIEVVNKIEGEATQFATEIDVLRRVLRPSTFEGKFAQHLEGFVGREWVFKAYEEWLEHQPESRVFWLKAGPGFGKSALAVNLANRYRGAVIGTWFCDSQSSELRDPRRAVMTIAFQLATRWPDYRVRLLKKLELSEESTDELIQETIQTLGNKDLGDLFSLIISEPLAGLIWRERKLVILMDALDEASETDGQNALTALISRRFLELPKWISFVVTSRPDASVVGHLQRFKPFELSAEDRRNTDDLALYYRKEIGGLKVMESLSEEDKEKLCTHLVEKAEGMILYLRMVAEGLHEGTLSLGDLDSMQGGLGGLYSRYHQTFSSRFRDDFEETIQPLLRLVMAAPGPLPLDLAAEVLGWTKEKVRKVRAKIGSYLEGGPEGTRFFHKTLADWLENDISGEFYTCKENAEETLVSFLWSCFHNREKTQLKITNIEWATQVLNWIPKIDLFYKEKDDYISYIEFERERQLWGLLKENAHTKLIQKILKIKSQLIGDGSDAGKLKSLVRAMSSPKSRKIYFCYAHDDNREVVEYIKNEIEIFGHRVWVIYDRIGKWEDIRVELTERLCESEMAFAFLSIATVREPGFCRTEIAMALNHFGYAYPVMLEKVPHESMPILLRGMSDIQWLDVINWREDNYFNYSIIGPLSEMIILIEKGRIQYGDKTEISDEELQRILQPILFTGYFSAHLEGFVGRSWIFERCYEWIDEHSMKQCPECQSSDTKWNKKRHQWFCNSCEDLFEGQSPESAGGLRSTALEQSVFWVSAPAGFGKTALAVNLAARFRGSILASWFCDKNDTKTLDAKSFIVTIAYNFALRLEDYRIYLNNNLGISSDKNQWDLEEVHQTLLAKSVEELFNILIKNPILCTPPLFRVIILIDGIDEANNDNGENSILLLINEYFSTLSDRINFIITSRYNAKKSNINGNVCEINIREHNIKNLEDLELFSRSEIGRFIWDKVSSEENYKICCRLAEKANGSILYLKMIVEGLKEGTIEVDDLEIMEGGLADLYRRYYQSFSSLFPVGFDDARSLLSVVIAAPAPIPLELASEILGWTPQKGREVRAKIGSYLEDFPEGLKIFHPTLADWLSTEKSREYFTDHEFGKNEIRNYLQKCSMNHGNIPNPWGNQIRDWLLLLN